MRDGQEKHKNGHGKMSIELTDSARKKISEIYQSHGKMVRLMITAGGCQGFNKSWEMVDDHESDDLVLSLDAGALLIDSATMEIISGSTIDYEVTLGGQQFVLKVPHATSTCGCGTSFSF